MNSSLPPAYGGAEIAAYRYAERYSRVGGEVLFVGPEGDQERDESPVWVQAVRTGDIHTRLDQVPGGRILSTAMDLWPILWNARHDWDLVHIFNSASLFNLMAVPLARLLRKPIVLEMSLRGSDDPISLRTWGRPGMVPRVQRPPVRYALFRAANHYVAKSEALRSAYLEAGLEERNLTRIPYGVDVRLYRPASADEKAALRSRLNLPRDAVLLLFVGGINPRKGLHWLIEAFGKLDKKVNAALILVGPESKYDPAYAASLRASVANGAKADCVHFVTGLCTNVEEYMRASDVFVLPSVREGLPIAILEAMASGLAVLASDIPEIADSQITDGIEGRLFPTGDVTTLRSLMQELIVSRQTRESLASAARLRAEREFSTAVVDRRYLQLYTDLLQSSSMQL